MICRMEKNPKAQLSALQRQLLARLDDVKHIIKEHSLYGGQLLPSAQQTALSNLDLALVNIIRAFAEERSGLNQSRHLKVRAAGAS
jgi:hypothetical protein